MEALNKSVTDAIDSLIDELFEDEAVAKSMIKEDKPEKETADEALAAVPKAEKDEKRKAGRPEQISEVPQIDTDGDRSGKYDEKIAQKHTDGSKKEDEQVEVPALMKKSLSLDEYEDYMALKKARKIAEHAEILEKARKEQTDLIKSAISEATLGMRKENQELRKSLQEQSELIKSMANKPQRSKSITSMQALEKFEKSQTSSSASMSKAELLDIAEELVKSKRNEGFTMEHAIELENTGYIFDPAARAMLEREVSRRNK
jgi:hypothetical protein